MESYSERVAGRVYETGGQARLAAVISFEEARRKRAEWDRVNGRRRDGLGSGYGHRRPSLVGDVVSLGPTTMILFGLCVVTVLAGVVVGLYVN